MSKFNTSFEYFDPNRINEKYTFTTTIWLSSDGCSISGYSNLDKEFVYLQFLADFKLNIYNPLIPRIKDLLSLPNVSTLIEQSSLVKFIIDESRFSLVPSSLFQEDQIEAIFNLTNHSGVHEKLICSEIESFDHHLIFPINDILLEFLSNHLTAKVEVSTISKEIISSLNHLTQSRDKVHVHFCTDQLFISVKKSNDLIFANSFRFSNQDDAIYFIVYSLEKLGFEPKETELTVSGSIDKSDALIKSIQSYTGPIRILNISDTKNLFFKLNLAETHYFPQLFNIA